jgi:hypothetical protein
MPVNASLLNTALFHSVKFSQVGDDLMSLASGKHRVVLTVEHLAELVSREGYLTTIVRDCDDCDLAVTRFDLEGSEVAGRPVALLGAGLLRTPVATVRSAGAALLRGGLSAGVVRAISQLLHGPLHQLGSQDGTDVITHTGTSDDTHEAHVVVTVEVHIGLGLERLNEIGVLGEDWTAGVASGLIDVVEDGATRVLTNSLGLHGSKFARHLGHGSFPSSRVTNDVAIRALHDLLGFTADLSNKVVIVSLRHRYGTFLNCTKNTDTEVKAEAGAASPARMHVRLEHLVLLGVGLLSIVQGVARDIAVELNPTRPSDFRISKAMRARHDELDRLATDDPVEDDAGATSRHIAVTHEDKTGAGERRTEGVFFQVDGLTIVSSTITGTDANGAIPLGDGLDRAELLISHVLEAFALSVLDFTLVLKHVNVVVVLLFLTGSGTAEAATATLTGVLLCVVVVTAFKVDDVRDDSLFASGGTHG